MGLGLFANTIRHNGTLFYIRLFSFQIADRQGKRAQDACCCGCWCNARRNEQLVGLRWAKRLTIWESQSIQPRMYICYILYRYPWFNRLDGNTRQWRWTYRVIVIDLDGLVVGHISERQSVHGQYQVSGLESCWGSWRPVVDRGHVYTETVFRSSSYPESEFSAAILPTSSPVDRHSSDLWGRNPCVGVVADRRGRLVTAESSARWVQWRRVVGGAATVVLAVIVVVWSVTIRSTRRDVSWPLAGLFVHIAVPLPRPTQSMQPITVSGE